MRVSIFATIAGASCKKVHSEPLGRPAGALLKCQPVPADAFDLVLAFSFALVLAVLESRSCELRLGLGLGLRLSFRLGLRDDLCVVTLQARTSSGARPAIADGE